MSEVRWLSAQENPWPVAVVDVRPVTLGMMSTSGNPLAAQNALSYNQDDGAEFEHVALPSVREVPTALRYRIDPDFGDGALFRPTRMEDKWALFVRRGRLLFVRSWMRELVVAGLAHIDGQYLTVTDVEGSFGDNEPVELTAAITDFIIRSHGLGLVHPAPLPFDPGSMLDQAAMFCFSMYGRQAQYATHQLWNPPAPDVPLRILHDAG